MVSLWNSMDDNTSTLSGLYFLPPFYKIARSFLKYHRRILGTYVANLPSRRGLRSSCSDCLVQPPVHRSTVGSRAFSVASPQMWNCLPPEVTSASSLTTFRTRLNMFLSVHWFISWHSAHLTFLCPHNVYTMDLAVF